MTTAESKIAFGTMLGYPIMSATDKMQTKHFLDGSREIITLIENFGTIFAPVVYDMTGNLERLQKGYLENPEQNHYLEEMIVADMKSSKLYAEPLLWLKRALELINYFFTNILDDKTCQESLIEHLKAAYTKTLQPYHGWLVQGAFNLIYRWVPYRSSLVGTGAENDTNMKHLEVFLGPMKLYLDQINVMFDKHNLHQTKKA